MALIITRRSGESIRIGDALINLKIEGKNRIKVSITAPKDVKVERPEKDADNKELSTSGIK